MFYDVSRQKFAAQCDIKKVSSYNVAGDYLIIGTRGDYKKIALPFSQRLRDGDFLFYTALNDSILPNPLTSVKDLIPTNYLERLTDFTVYPSCFSLSHYAVGSKDYRWIFMQLKHQDFEFSNDANGENMFTMAVKRSNTEVVWEVMKTLNEFTDHKLVKAIELIPLEDIMWYMTPEFVSLTDNAFVPAISDEGIPIPTLSWQGEDEIIYTKSPQNRYNAEVHKKLHG